MCTAEPLSEFADKGPTSEKLQAFFNWLLVSCEMMACDTQKSMAPSLSIDGSVQALPASKLDSGPVDVADAFWNLTFWGSQLRTSLFLVCLEANQITPFTTFRPVPVCCQTFKQTVPGTVLLLDKHVPGASPALSPKCKPANCMKNQYHCTEGPSKW